MSVTISLELVRDSPSTTAQIHGSVRVEIDGNVVTRFTDADGTEFEYVGTGVVIDVGDFVGTLIELKNREHALYDRIVVDVGGPSPTTCSNRCPNTNFGSRYKSYPTDR